MALTQRDHLLFRNLSSYGMLTTKQIAEIIFQSIARTTVLRRLRILESSNLLKRIVGLESHENLWILTEKGANVAGVVLAKRHWSKNLLEHDHKLLSVRLELEKCGIAQSWIPEHQIRSLTIKKHGINEAKKKLIPDGLMSTDLSNHKGPVAIEVELTLKSQHRIEDIVKLYHDKKDLQAVWYISNSETILKSVFKEWIKYKNSNNPVCLFGSIYEDIILNSKEAKIWNQNRVLKLSDIWGISPAHIPAPRVSTFNNSLNQPPLMSNLRNHDELMTS